MQSYFKIKVWLEEEKRWKPSYYYIKTPKLLRTIGYMCQSEIDNLPTRVEVINKIYKAKL